MRTIRIIFYFRAEIRFLVWRRILADTVDIAVYFIKLWNTRIALISYYESYTHILTNRNLIRRSTLLHSPEDIPELTSCIYAAVVHRLWLNHRPNTNRPSMYIYIHIKGEVRWCGDCKYCVTLNYVILL